LDAREAACEQTDAALTDANTQIYEKLHQVAFRTGLGNPVFASADALHGLKRADIHEFAAKNFTTENITIVGSGVAHEELTKLVESSVADIKFHNSAPAPAKSTFHSGEARIEAGPHSEAQYVIAYPGVSYTSPDYFASKVLASLLGGSQKVKYASKTGLLGAACTPSTFASAFTASYADIGLIGIHITGSDIKSVSASSIAALKSLSTSITPEALASAKKAALISAEDELTRDGLLEAFAKNSAFGVKELAGIDGVTAAQVMKLAKDAVAAKPCVVAYGNLLTLPYADEL
jgi:predicted Zn-dependent peptidase